MNSDYETYTLLRIKYDTVGYPSSSPSVMKRLDSMGMNSVRTRLV